MIWEARVGLLEDRGHKELYSHFAWFPVTIRNKRVWLQRYWVVKVFHHKYPNIEPEVWYFKTAHKHFDLDIATMDYQTDEN